MTTNEAVKTKPIDYKKQKSLFEKIKLYYTLLPSLLLLPLTIYRYYTKGPSAKSWSLAQELKISFTREFLYRSNNITVEDYQELTKVDIAPAKDIDALSITIPNSYRVKTGKVLSSIFTPLERYQIGWDWNLNDQPELTAEWMQKKDEPTPIKTLLYLHGGAYYHLDYAMYRPFLTEFIQGTNVRTIGPNYRLAPQSPFPAGLQDALATYMYLLDPPIGKPIDPKDIIIAGDSAGGGLTMSLLLAIRDGNLPLPAGAITLSGFFDVSHSLPSFKENIMTDFLPPLGFKHIPSPSLNYDALPKSKAPLPEGYESDTYGDDYERYQFYAPNKALRIPMVSPVFDRKHLRGLPRLFMLYGDAERLRDESIYAAFLATNHYKPSSSEKPTQVHLETYVDQPHVFTNVFKHEATQYAMKSMVKFIEEVYQQQQQEEDLEVYKIEQNGSVTENKAALLNEITLEKLDDWTSRLNNPSFKDRAERLKAAYQLQN